MFKNVEIIKLDLKTRDYAFVELHSDIIEKIKLCEEILTDFFSQTDNDKYNHDFIFGYLKTPHKQVFRYKTINSGQQFPPTFTELLNFGKLIELELKSLANVLFPGYDKIDNISTDWSLIDAVYYNNATVRNNNLNIVEHIDPGLLTFSFLSSQPGLQLKNEFDEWIDPPNNVGVLWTGNAVKNLEFIHQHNIHQHSIHPCGIHRVYCVDKPRLAMWIEIPTKEQARDDITTGKYYGYENEIALMEKEGFHPDRNSDGIITSWTHKSTENLFGYNAVEVITTGSNKVAFGDIALF